MTEHELNEWLKDWIPHHYIRIRKIKGTISPPYRYKVFLECEIQFNDALFESQEDAIEWAKRKSNETGIRFHPGIET